MHLRIKYFHCIILINPQYIQKEDTPQKISTTDEILDTSVVEKYFYSDSLERLFSFLRSAKDNNAHVLIEATKDS